MILVSRLSDLLPLTLTSNASLCLLEPALLFFSSSPSSCPTAGEERAAGADGVKAGVESGEEIAPFALPAAVVAIADADADADGEGTDQTSASRTTSATRDRQRVVDMMQQALAVMHDPALPASPRSATLATRVLHLLNSLDRYEKWDSVVSELLTRLPASYVESREQLNVLRITMYWVLKVAYSNDLVDACLKSVFRMRWIPTSALELAQAEERLLSFLKKPYQHYPIHLENKCCDKGCFIWMIHLQPDQSPASSPGVAAPASPSSSSSYPRATFSCESSTSSSSPSPRSIRLHRRRKPVFTRPCELTFSSCAPPSPAVEPATTRCPIVLLHGMGFGSAIWSMNLETLSQDRHVYAIDMLGFGQSARPDFGTDAAQAEDHMVNGIEAWRKKVGLTEAFILMGHGFGGFIATAYALKYPRPVVHLILVDPWGFAPKQTQVPATKLTIEFPPWIQTFSKFNYEYLYPLSMVRLAGPGGRKLVQKLQSDLGRKFAALTGDAESTVAHDYIYHANAQQPASGEAAYQQMCTPDGWATRPMIDRVTELATGINLTFIMGDRSWIDPQPARQIKEQMRTRIVEAHVFERTGHHVYLDKVDKFHTVVRKSCATADTAAAKRRSQELGHED